MLDPKAIYQIISDAAIVPAKDLESILKENNDDYLKVLPTVIQRNIIPEEELWSKIAKHFNIPYAKLKDKQIEDKVLKTIPEVVAQKYRIIAFEQDAKGIKIATSDPQQQEAIDQIKKKLGVDVQVNFTSDEEIESALALYKSKSGADFKNLVPSLSGTGAVALGAAPITNIVQKLLEYAIDNKASDVHIEPMRNFTIVRFRIDGVLHDIVKLPKNIHEEVVSRIKVLAHLRTDEHQAAQDGKLQIIYGQKMNETPGSIAISEKPQTEADKQRIDVRVSIAPITNGENIVMRLLSDKGRQYTLTNLGLLEKDFEKLKKEIAKSWGTILSVGPTGSGKTTTLYAILKVLNQREVNIATIEDPVEYDIEGVSQIQVNPNTDLSFANGLRALVRQDPDIIMVGEIRDKETAGIAVNAAMTGHLVLSTLHANDAATTLPRLNQMEIEPYLIASTINLIIAQRIVRRICTKCTEQYQEPIETFQKNLPEVMFNKYFKAGMGAVTLSKGKGCPVCHQSGYSDRVGIFEVLDVSPEIEKLITSKAAANEIAAQAIKEGMTTMLDDGISKVLKGITTLDEVLRVTRE
jgi:type IV pilus assembly protein PilB